MCWKGSGVRAPEFFICNDEVNGCEFRGGETGQEVRTGQAGALSGLLDALTDTQRTLCGSLENAGLLQWLVFAAARKRIAIIMSPSLSSPREEFLLNLVCVGFLCLFLFSPLSPKCLQGCWLLSCHQLMSLFEVLARPKCAAVQGMGKKKAHLISFCAVPVFSSVVPWVLLCQTWFSTRCLFHLSTCQLVKTSENANRNVFIAGAAVPLVSSKMFYRPSENLSEENEQWSSKVMI